MSQLLLFLTWLNVVSAHNEHWSMTCLSTIFHLIMLVIHGFQSRLTPSSILHLQVHGHVIHSDGVQYVQDALEHQNQVQSLLPEPHSHQRRWSHQQHRSVGVLPQPEPEEETKPFILDLKNFPDLANADINSQNPNIQVSQEKISLKNKTF